MEINKSTEKSRNDLAKMFGEMGFKRGAEIGVRHGDFSKILCESIKSLEKLYLVDPYATVPEDPRSKIYTPERQEQFYETARKNVAGYPVCEFVRKTSMEAVRDIDYGSLDFVYIDGAHTFDYVMTDIIEWARRVRKGGIVFGDDYKPHKTGDVITPVDTYVKAHKIKTLNVIFNNDYQVPNWWFVKP